MDERFVKKLIAPSFAIVVLSTVFLYELKYLIDQILFKKKHMLVIGILSAPENFQQRASVRNTWLQLLSEISGSAYFIVGNEICEVPLIDRPDPYTCISRPFVLPENATTETEFTTLEMSVSDADIPKPPLPNYIGFGFYVRSQIQIRKLGILGSVLQVLETDVQVKLISIFNKKVLASVTFEPLLPNEKAEDFFMKAIKPVTLNEYSEALVKIEIPGASNMLLPDCRQVDWIYGSSTINYVHLWSSDSVMPHPFTQKSCTYVTMAYTVVDIDKIKSTIKNRNLRLKEWHLHNKKLSVKLSNESKIHNDILFIDVVDVYRNISLKLINFYKRVLETEYFHYILKTDDDSFVDLLRVHNQLTIVNKEIDDEIGLTIENNKQSGIITKQRLSKFWWWSFFREFWKVQHFGKWRESLYRSASYPLFPCGGGYVVNKGIIDYIVSNEHNLNFFQGEDVSMGIWLSSLLVTNYRTPGLVITNSSNELQRKIFTKYRGKLTKLKNDKFAPDTCQWTCSSEINSKLPSCNRVQMSIKEMYDTWNDYITNGFV